MKKTILKTTVLAAIASLAMSGYTWAHHPSEEMNPNYDTIDENISDIHNTVMDAMLEDAEDDSLMASTSQGMDGGEPTMADGVGANASQSSAQAAAQTDSQVVSAPGAGSNNATRGSAGGR